MNLFPVKEELEQLQSSIEERLGLLFRSARFIGGPEVESFEKEFAEYCGSRFCVGCANGTDALMAALWALGVGAGDEVILPAFTFTATAEAVALLGARPVFVDINQKDDYCLDLSAVESAITPRTAAVIAVHLYGIPAEMPKLRRLCERYGLALVEDAAQAHGSRLDGKPVGSLGDIACFSFYPTKNLGALGDAGAVTTDDAELARRVRLFINHGRKTHTEHVAVGRNARLDSIQAAVLRLKLRYLDEWLLRRRLNRKLYQKLLSNTRFKLRNPQRNVEVGWHIMVVEVEGRNKVMELLRAKNIPCGIHYPEPLHTMRAWSYLGYRKGEFPESEKAASGVVSLPVHQYLSAGDVELICSELHSLSTQRF